MYWSLQHSFFLLHSLTKLFPSPCCGQPSIRSASSNINCRVQWSRESYNQTNSFTLKANQTKTNSSFKGKPCGTRNKVMKTRGLTTYPKQLTNLCSPCCDHLSIRSSSFIINCRVQWSGESYNQTNSLLKCRPGGIFKLSHTISKYVDVA